ncbi:MAG: hypothetical protein ACYTDE_06535 [Planctomycetota bacterium]
MKRIRQVSASINAAIASERADQVDPDQPEEGGLPRGTELDGLLADDLRRQLKHEADEEGGDREGEEPAEDVEDHERSFGVRRGPR